MSRVQSLTDWAEPPKPPAAPRPTCLGICPPLPFSSTLDPGFPEHPDPRGIPGSWLTHPQQFRVREVLSQGPPWRSQRGPCLQPRSVTMPPLTLQGVEELRALAKHGRDLQLHFSQEAGPSSLGLQSWEVCCPGCEHRFVHAHPHPRNRSVCARQHLPRRLIQIWKSGLQQTWRRGDS